MESLASTLVNFRVFNGCKKSNVSLIYEHRGISGFNELVNETRQSSYKLDGETCSIETHRKYTSFFIPFLLLQLYYRKERPLPGEKYLFARCFFKKNYKLSFGGLALHSQAPQYLLISFSRALNPFKNVHLFYFSKLASSLDE